MGKWLAAGAPPPRSTQPQTPGRYVRRRFATSWNESPSCSEPEQITQIVEPVAFALDPALALDDIERSLNDLGASGVVVRLLLPVEEIVDVVDRVDLGDEAVPLFGRRHVAAHGVPVAALLLRESPESEPVIRRAHVVARVEASHLILALGHCRAFLCLRPMMRFTRSGRTYRMCLVPSRTMQ